MNKLASVAAFSVIALLGPCRALAPQFEPPRKFDWSGVLAPRDGGIGRNFTIPELLINAAHRYDIPIGLLATVSYLESRLSDVTRVETNGTRSCGPLQTNEQFFPGICEAPLEEKIDRGAKFLAALFGQCKDDWAKQWAYPWYPPQPSPWECAAHRYRYGH
jgi:hypothetical protein